MTKLLRPRLINGSFGDPLVYCGIAYVGRAFTFDLGASFDLVNRELLRIDAVYLSHAHMDHIFGFEHLLRANLKQDRTIQIFGPKGIQRQIRGKLQGFTWNLVQGYGLEFVVHELHAGQETIYQFKSAEGFRMHNIDTRVLKNRIIHPIHKTDYYTVYTAGLDHRISSQAYAVVENIAVSINKEVLEKRGWIPGPWLQQLKQLAIKGRGKQQQLEVPVAKKRSKSFVVSDLVAELIIPRKRNRITYVTDAAMTAKNRQRILKLAADADIFFCEAAFLERDRDKAMQTHHMTAKEVGCMAKEAGAQRLVLFHFSKKYLNTPQLLIDEASAAFGKKAEANPSYVPHHTYRRLPQQQS